MSPVSAARAALLASSCKEKLSVHEPKGREKLHLTVLHEKSTLDMQLLRLCIAISGSLVTMGEDVNQCVVLSYTNNQTTRSTRSVESPIYRAMFRLAPTRVKVRHVSELVLPPSTIFARKTESTAMDPDTILSHVPFTTSGSLVDCVDSELCLSFSVMYSN
jgi:hypothetical protein